METHKLSLDDFKRWMKETHEENKPQKVVKDFVGLNVESKVGKSILLDKMTMEKGSVDVAVKFFLELGGTVDDVNDKYFTIRINEDQIFSIHRCYVKRI